MKLLLCLLLNAVIANGQYSATELYSASHLLNGGARASIGGISRIAVPFVVPRGCHQIIFSINTTSGGQTPAVINLTDQVAALLPTSQSITLAMVSSIAKSIAVSQQYGVLSVYGYNLPACAQAFVNKAPRQCNTQVAMINITGGTFPLSCDASDWGKTYYLCIMNPKTLTSTDFHIEVTAIIGPN